MSRSLLPSALAPSRARHVRRLFLGLALVAPVILAAAVPAVAAHAATFRVTAPQSARVGVPFAITLSVRDSVDLAGYETTLLFDESAAHFGGVQQLRNDIRRSGRGVRPLGHQEVQGGVSFGFYSCPARDCVTRSHPAAPLGRVGELRLTRVEMTADTEGVLELRLAGARFVDSAGRSLAVSGTDGVIRVHVGSSKRVHPAPSLAWHGSSTDSRGAERSLDLDGNGIVTHSDAMSAAYAWTMARVAGDPCGTSVDRAADTNGDGCLDVTDLQLIAARSSPRGAVATWAPRQRDTLATIRTAGPALPAATQPTSGVTFTVNSTADTADSNRGNGTCATSAGVCTLRAAIEEANRVAGGATVAFGITGGGSATKTITLGSRLPIINNESGPVVIDGYTQAQSAVNTAPAASNAVIRIQITGPGETVQFPALYITSADNTIRGLAIYRMWRDIWLDGPGAHDNAIVGNFVGTNAAGTYNTPSWNHANGALMMSDGPADNQIGRPVLADRNVVSGGPASGVYHTHEGTEHNLVQNNIVGLNPAGTAALPNKLEGVDYNFGASNNQDGGTGPLEHNVQSGNSRTGAETSHGTNTLGNKFIGNYVGTDVTGTRVFSYTRNLHYGIHVEDGSGDTVVSDNVICGNTNSGVRIDGIGTHNTLVTRNRIGITLDGTAAGNALSGIRVVYHTVGGTISENVIAFNPRGIDIRDVDNDFFTISRNSIYGNTGAGEAGLGIDLFPQTGVNENDANDADGGANQQLNYPVLGTATTALVTGTACASCIVEVFRADHPAGQFGSGQTFVGSGTAGTNGSFSVAVAGLAVGDPVTSTATDTAGNTSEFSRNVAVSAAGVFASDTFTRTLTDSWGSADIGGAWSRTGAAADFDVNGTAGVMTLPTAGANRAAHLNAVSARDVIMSVRVRIDKVPVGGSLYTYQVARRISNGNEYRIKLRVAPSGQLFVQASRVVGGTETALGTEVNTGLTVTNGVQVSLRSSVVGVSPTTLRIRAWLGATEPSAWAYTTTDSTAALQAAGAVGLRAYLGTAATNAPMTVRFDDLSVAAP